MGKVSYPPLRCPEFKFPHEFDLPLDGVDAAAEAGKAIKNAIAARVPLMDSADLDRVLQKLGYPTSDVMIDNLAHSIAKQIVTAGGSVQQQVVQAHLRIRAGNSCEDYSVLSVADTTLKMPSATTSIGIPDLLSVKVTISVRTIEGLMRDKYCHDSPKHEAYIAAYAAFDKRRAEYERRMKEWRMKLARYIETHGESEFPTAPMDLPPPWADELQPPPPPPQGLQKQLECLLVWSIVTEVSIPVGSVETPPVDFQEGNFVIIGPCCCPDK